MYNNNRRQSTGGGPSSRESTSKSLKLMPGLFSNHANITAHTHNEYGMRSKSPQPHTSDYRQQYHQESQNNISMESMNRMFPSQMSQPMNDYENTHFKPSQSYGDYQNYGGPDPRSSI